MDDSFQQQNLILRDRISNVLVKFMLPYIALLLLITIINNLIPVFLPSRMLVTVVALVSLVPAFILHRKQRDYAACLILIIMCTLAPLLAVFINGGVDAPGIIAFLVPLSMIVWISSPRTSILYTAGYIATGITASVLQQNGYIPLGGHLSPVTRMIHYSVYVMAVTGASILGYRMLHKTLRENIEKQNLLDSTFSSVDDAVLVLDGSYNILRGNDSALALRERLSEAGKEESLLQIEFESPELESTTLVELIKSHDNRISQMKLRSSGTKQKPWLLITVTPLRAESAASGMVVVLRDITEQVEQEYHLRMTQKMDAVGQLASGIAHDFNNMLGSIQGAAELLDLKARDDQKEMLSLIFKATDKASKLTRELLLFTRKGPKKSSSIDIHEIIGEVSFLLSRTLNKNITVRKDLLADDFHVIGDNTQIQSALMNMAINASHAMPLGGILTLRTRTTSLDEHYCRQSTFDIEPGDYIVIEVRDTGTGIPEDTLLHIFEPFFTTKEVGKGTGLGLSAVYGMVQKHGGAIDVVSRVGEGTVFHIFLPLDHNVSAGDEKENIRSDYLAGSGDILIVDDEQFIRITSAEMLGAMGYTVFTVENGEQALSFLEKRDVDLVILDMIMPVKNGRDTFFEMKQRGYTMPVILSSGFSEESDALSLKQNGLFGFISKPFQRYELSQIVSKALARKSNT